MENGCESGGDGESDSVKKAAASIKVTDFDARFAGTLSS